MGVGVEGLLVAWHVNSLIQAYIMNTEKLKLISVNKTSQQCRNIQLASQSPKLSQHNACNRLNLTLPFISQCKNLKHYISGQQQCKSNTTTKKTQLRVQYSNIKLFFKKNSIIKLQKILMIVKNATLPEDTQLLRACFLCMLNTIVRNLPAN